MPTPPPRLCATARRAFDRHEPPWPTPGMLRQDYCPLRQALCDALTWFVLISLFWLGKWLAVGMVYGLHPVMSLLMQVIATTLFLPYALAALLRFREFWLDPVDKALASVLAGLYLGGLLAVDVLVVIGTLLDWLHRAGLLRA